MTVWLFVLSVLIASAFYVRRVGLNLSGSSVLLGLLLLFHGPAYLFYTRQWGPETDFFERILGAASGADVISTLDVALALTFICVCAGIACADRLLQSGKHLEEAIRIWPAIRISASRVTVQRSVHLAFATLVVVLLPMMLIDNQVSNVWEFVTSDLGEFDKIALRREIGGSSYYLYNLLLSAVIPSIAFCLVGVRAAGHRNVMPILVIFIAFVGLAKAATLSKAPLAIFVLQLVVVWVMCRSLKLHPRTLLKLVALSLVLFITAAVVANPDLDAASLVLSFLFYRIFMIVNESLLEYFAAIPHVIPHSWGGQVSWLAGLFQQEPSLPTYWLVGEVHRGAIGSTTTVMFMGDAWADFAWVGVVLVSLAIGFFIRFLDIHLIVKRGKTVASITGLAIVHFGVYTSLNTSLQTSLVTGGLLFAAPIAAWLGARSQTSERAPSRSTAEQSASR